MLTNELISENSNGKIENIEIIREFIETAYLSAGLNIADYVPSVYELKYLVIPQNVQLATMNGVQLFNLETTLLYQQAVYEILIGERNSDIDRLLFNVGHKVNYPINKVLENRLLHLNNLTDLN